MPVRHPAAIQAEGLFGSLAVQRYKKCLYRKSTDKIIMVFGQNYKPNGQDYKSKRTKLQVQTDKI